jgi:hypothetical protein
MLRHPLVMAIILAGLAVILYAMVKDMIKGSNTIDRNMRIEIGVAPIRDRSPTPPESIFPD